MDLDKPLEEMISDKKTNQGARRGNGAPRSRGRGNGPTPYARPPPRSTEEKWVHDAYEDNVARGGRRGGGGGAPRGGYSGFNSTLAGTGVGFTGVSPRIEVVGLHYEVTPADLKYDRSGRSRGEATMEFASYQEAKIAINKFDGAMTKGQTISIRLLPPARTPPAAGAVSGGPGRGGAQTGASLLARLGGQGGASGASNAPRGGAGSRGRGAPRARGGDAARGRGGAKRGLVNEGDLDKELDNFMAPAEGEKAPTADVEMA